MAVVWVTGILTSRFLLSQAATKLCFLGVTRSHLWSFAFVTATRLRLFSCPQVECPSFVPIVLSLGMFLVLGRGRRYFRPGVPISFA